MIRRSLVPLLCAVVVATGCGSPTPTPTPAPPTGNLDSSSPAPTGPVRSGGSSGSLDGSAGPGTGPNGGQGGGPAPAAVLVPADIAADVEAVFAATTPEATTAATRTILERSGVVIADDPTTVKPTPAGIYLSTLELDRIADEAMSAATMSRVSFADFASKFGGIAGLSPNDGLLADLATVDFGVPLAPPEAPPLPDPAAPPPPNAAVELELSSYPRRMATFLTDWLRVAATQHGSSEPELAALTSPPLYLQAFAQRQSTPVDLGAAFVADDLKLGSLQLTILIAGMRATLAYADADMAAGGSSPDLVLASLRRPVAPAAATPTVEFSDCDGLRRLLDAAVPLSMPIGMAGKEFVKSMVQGFITGLFGALTDLRAAVGPAFTALGMLFRLAALDMLYGNSVVQLQLDPGFIHKPTGSAKLATASVRAGISDAAWAAAREQRANDFWSTALRTCARLLGLPVPSDIIDLGDAIKHWVVQWEITRGLGRHVLLHEDELEGPGVVASRRERPLVPESDPSGSHSGWDILAIDVLPELESDHPGTERTDPVTVCARVVPRHPPNGLKTLLSAGMAGKSLASTALTGATPYSALFSLASVIGDLLMSWYREVGTIDACQSMSVSYHVPEPAPWRGTVTVNYVSRTELTSSSVQYEGWGTRPGEPSHGSGTERTNADVTETFYVGGTDDEQFQGYVSLAGNSFVHGVEYKFGEGSGVRFSASCKLQVGRREESGGGWTLTGDATGSLTVYPDGKYQINLYGARADEEIVLPGHQVNEVTILEGPCDPNPSETNLPIHPIHPVPPGGIIDGWIDPENPGDRLAGSQTIVWDETSYTVITWDLNHAGPIRLPQH